jgi:hypothetical protein
MAANQLAAFRSHADQHGTTMSALVLGWIEAALAGSPPTPVSPTSTPATEIPGSGDALAAQVDLLSSLLTEAKTQTQLLQQLTQQAATTPHGGTEPRRVVITEPEVIPSGLMSAADFMSPPAPSTPDGYRAVEESEVVKGLQVWMKNRGSFGEVLEPPMRGVTRVQSSDPGRAPEHVHVDQLMVPTNA